MIYAAFGDTKTPIYDPPLDDTVEKEVPSLYAEAYPQYVRNPKSSSLPSWIEASPNRNRIRATLWVLVGLLIILAAILVIFNPWLWKNLKGPFERLKA